MLPKWFNSGLFFLAGLTITLCLTTAARAEDPEPVDLTALAETTYNRLFEEGLFDPSGAEWVFVSARSLNYYQSLFRSDCWLRVEDDGVSRLYMADGASLHLREKWRPRPIDFLQHCQARLRWMQQEVNRRQAEERTPLSSREPRPRFTCEDLYLAAWLHRLGEQELAAELFEQIHQLAGNDFELYVAGSRNERYASHYEEMEADYLARRDKVACIRGQWLAQLYADLLAEQPPVAEFVANLQAQSQAGTLLPDPETPLPENFANWTEAEKDQFRRDAHQHLRWKPHGFNTWEPQAKLDYLLETLPELEMQQKSYPRTSIELKTHWRIRELVLLGDLAVPRLIEMIAQDSRYLRSRDRFRDVKLVSVREAAYVAVALILEMDIYERPHLRSRLTSEGAPEGTEIARRLQQYWENVAQLPFAEQKMGVLCDDTAPLVRRREAAASLAFFDEPNWTADQIILAAHFDITFPQVQYIATQPNSLREHFENPTLAEALFALMCEDLAQSEEGSFKGNRNQRESFYFTLLVALGDERIAPRLAERFAEEPLPRMRQRLAFTCLELGEGEPWSELVADLAAGQIFAEADLQGDHLNNLDTETLRDMLYLLSQVNSQAGDRAAWSLVDPEHPYYATAKRQLRRVQPYRSNTEPWLSHSCCLGILHQMLWEEGETDITCGIERSTLFRKDANGSTGTIPPAWLTEDCIDEITERACDLPAMHLSELVYGLPRYHPLATDAPERLQSLRGLVSHYDDHYRMLSRQEKASLELTSGERCTFLPAIGLLQHPATAEDFEHGRAIFHLQGRGELTELALPAIAVIPSASPDPATEPLRGLIVQAERDTVSGQVTYGILFREGPQSLSGSDVTEVLPLVQALEE